MDTPSDRYTRTAIIIHWVLALLLLGQIGFGWFLEGVPRGTPERSIYVNLHKSTGICLGLLILFRVYWRIRHGAPAFPKTMPPWEQTLARLSHAGLYACMLIMPLSGYIASNFSKWGVNFFNTFKWPPWGFESDAIYEVFNTTHVITSFVFVALIALHIVGALRHLFRRDGVFDRMRLKRAQPG